MSPCRTSRPPLWLRLVVTCSSWQWQPPRNLEQPDADAVQEALATGWRLRSASPRWDSVWRSHPEVLRRCRVILVPDIGFGMTPPERLAQLRLRLAEHGVDAPAPDPFHLHAGQRKRVTALAPGTFEGLSDREIAQWRNR